MTRHQFIRCVYGVPGAEDLSSASGIAKTSAAGGPPPLSGLWRLSHSHLPLPPFARVYPLPPPLPHHKLFRCRIAPPIPSRRPYRRHPRLVSPCRSPPPFPGQPPPSLSGPRIRSVPRRPTGAELPSRRRRHEVPYLDGRRCYRPKFAFLDVCTRTFHRRSTRICHSHGDCCSCPDRR